MLRILDANLNRIGEALRLLEDISRFLLNDPALTEELKAMRHELLPRDSRFQARLLGARRAEEDVGAFLDVSGEGKREDAVSIVAANARRVQQSLRVLEEIGKTPGQDLGLDWDRVKHARFALYELEQKIVWKLLRHGKVEQVTGLYLVLDGGALGGRSDVEVSRQAIAGGAKVIQLRDTQRGIRELVPIAQELKKLCADSGILFIVNDYLELALASDADGLHIGQGDLPLTVARKLLPGDKIVGCSTATLPEALRAQDEGADYVAVGSIYPTVSKTGVRPAGLETLRQVKNEISVPVVAIGGINYCNVADVIAAGADAVAVINAVLGADDVCEASEQLAVKIEESRGVSE
ncbi:thiamine phosphate synthase [Chloroflexota bacterium]